jgi:hypothetical protein
MSVVAGRLSAMTKREPLPDSAYSPQIAGDDRTRPPGVGDERELLISFLEYYRRTIELKCSGVPKKQLAEPSAPPSTMTLHGLVRHLAGGEQWWFHHQFAQEDVTLLYEDPTTDFDPVGDFDEALATWRAMCEHSRQIVARSSLDDTGVRERTGEPVSLRRVMLHMIVEYARHSGHADFLREGIDGATGE